MRERIRGVLLDVDGTLIDSNDAHARAWVGALREAGFATTFERVRPLIGMGADKLLPAAAGLSADSPAGKRLQERRAETFRWREMRSVRAFAGTRALLQRMRAQGLRLAIASSARPDELGPLLERADVADLVERPSREDAPERSKPDPDVVHAGLAQLGCAPSEAVMLGDTPYDVEAAQRAGLVAVALRCGGWSDEALRGAAEVYDGPWDLLARYEDSALARRRGRAAVGL